MERNSKRFTIVVRGYLPDEGCIEDRLHWGGCDDADISYENTGCIYLTFDREYPDYHDATDEAMDQVMEAFADVLDSFVTINLEEVY